MKLLWKHPPRHDLDEAERLVLITEISRKIVKCLKLRQQKFQGFEIKKHSIFPSLPKNLSISELRKEIRRRLRIADQLGLIKKPNDLRG